MEETGRSDSRNILSGYAYYLADSGLIDKQQALGALKKANESKESYIEYLVRQKLLDESRIAGCTSEYFGLPLCDISSFDVNLIPSEYINMPFVRKRLALPLFKKHGLLYLAVFDPTMPVLSEIKFLTGHDIRMLVVEAGRLSEAIDGILNTLILSEISEAADPALKNIEVNAYHEEITDLSAFDVESAPIINYVNKVLLDAVEKSASDIHFERYESTYRIRYRQHGVLYSANTPPVKLANYILARIKVMSELDITEHRKPQDGRFKLIISSKRSIDFRVSICPTLFGEKTVLRILDTAKTLQNIESLGMSPDQRDHFLHALERSQGMILVTGPTGSGKTVTLYSALNHLNVPEKNISTAEDPVEIPMSGINQVPINVKTGLDFSAALRAFLRQDPDVIMVGEIRDLDTAEIAVKASQTGHLLLSTLHTNSAPDTVNRLMNMGVEPYNLAGCLALVIAQRLVRVLCQQCKVEETIPPDVLLAEGFSKQEIGTFKTYTAVGCDKCLHGFKGRIGIFEVMPVSKEMEALIMRSANAMEIAAQAKKEGIMNLRESGLARVKEGMTSLAELNRVFQ